MSYLYAVRMLIPNHEPQPIKVGFSTKPDKRKLAYSSGPYPCEWLGVWPGTMQDELNFHIQFYELNQGMKGEWFLPTEEFLQVITQKIEGHQEIVEQERAQAERDKEMTERDKQERIRAAQIMEDFAGTAALGLPPIRDYVREYINDRSALSRH